MSDFITDIDQIQAAGLPLDESTEFEVLAPHIRESELHFVKPVLGDAFYLQIKTELEEETPAQIYIDLLPLLQAPIAFNSYYRFYKIPGGQISHRGFQRDSVSHSEHAPKWEIDQLKESLICKADFALDVLINFLTDNSDTYPVWLESEYAKKNKGLIVPTASIFNQFVNISCSGRTFQKLLFERLRAERNIRKVVCTPMFERIQAELKGELPFTEEVTALLDYLRPMVVYDTMATGILMTHFHYTDQGIYLYSYNDGTLSKTAITPMEARNLANTWKEKYEEARVEAIEFLNTNITDYPEYQNSPCYSTEPRTLIPRYDNDITKKHFGI